MAARESSKEARILKQVQTTLQGITGAAYVFDLSGDDQVRIGGALDPDVLPCAFIYLVSVTTEQRAGRTPLRSYHRSAILQVEVFADVTSDTTSDAALAGADLLNDVMLALEGDRFLDDGDELVDDMEIDASTFLGDIDETSQVFASVVAQLRLAYREVAGT